MLTNWFQFGCQQTGRSGLFWWTPETFVSCLKKLLETVELCFFLCGLDCSASVSVPSADLCHSQTGLRKHLQIICPAGFKRTVLALVFPVGLDSLVSYNLSSHIYSLWISFISTVTAGKTQQEKICRCYWGLITIKHPFNNVCLHPPRMPGWSKQASTGAPADVWSR